MHKKKKSPTNVNVCQISIEVEEEQKTWKRKNWDINHDLDHLTGGNIPSQV